MEWERNLDERKKIILKAIIDDYIATVEPVGSRTIAKKFNLGLSSATIRNEMADLADMGFLSQPHTSSGRIPSEKGYRHYVDNMMSISELNTKEIQGIADSLEQRIGELSELIKIASGVISRLTKHTSIAMTPSMKKLIIKALQVVPIESGRALVIVVLEDGSVRNKLVSINVSLTADKLIVLSTIINEEFSGYPVDQISIIAVNNIANHLGTNRENILPIIDGIVDCMKHFESAEIYTNGTTNILSYPEFNDIDKARDLLCLLSKDDLLISLMTRDKDSDIIEVRIGTENGLTQINDCTLVTATYSFNKIIFGTIGILGPTRMDYSKVISSMEYVRKKLNKEIIKFANETL